MRTYIANGWKSVKDQFYVIIILFLYQLLWGYFLYRLVESAVVPLLMRYPDPPPNQLSQALYYIEAQMGLSENSTVHTYLWILLGIGVFRMLLTPFIQAGILYGLQEEYKGQRGLFFFQGMKKYGKPMFLFHIVEWALLAAPAYWLAPRLYSILVSGLQSQLLLLNAVPFIVAWLLYGYIVHQLLLYMQFGKIGGTRMISSLWTGIRNAVPMVGISIVLGIINLLIFGLSTGVSLIWAGLLGLILQQAYHLVTCIFKLWYTTSQFSLWHHKTEK